MKTPIPGPTNRLIGAPATQVYHPQPTPIRREETGGVRPAPVVAPPTITISRARRQLLSKNIIMTLGLSDGQRLDLVPGENKADPWQLDTCSRIGSLLRIRDDHKGWLTLAHPIDETHFRRRNSRGRTETLPTRTLSLLGESPTHQGVYLFTID